MNSLRLGLSGTSEVFQALSGIPSTKVLIQKLSNEHKIAFNNTLLSVGGTSEVRAKLPKTI